MSARRTLRGAPNLSHLPHRHGAHATLRLPRPRLIGRPVVGAARVSKASCAQGWVRARGTLSGRRPHRSPSSRVPMQCRRHRPPWTRLWSCPHRHLRRRSLRRLPHPTRPMRPTRLTRLPARPLPLFHPHAVPHYRCPRRSHILPRLRRDRPRLHRRWAHQHPRPRPPSVRSGSRLHARRWWRRRTDTLSSSRRKWANGVLSAGLARWSHTSPPRSPPTALAR